MSRPIQYNRSDVIDAAMQVFWAHGFSNSSVDKLVTATFLNKHSLYSAFDGKQGLFSACLEHYLSRYASAYLAVLNEGDGLDAINKYFSKILNHRYKNSAKSWGCLVANTAVEFGSENSLITKVIIDYYHTLTQALEKKLSEGQAVGDIRTDIDAHDMACCLVRILQGNNISKRLYSHKGTNECSLDTVLALITAPTH